MVRPGATVHFREFAAEWGFQHIMSSPRYPQSNGKAEAAVKSMKSAAWVRRGVDEAVLARALLQYRNTPSRRDGLSPAQKLFGRPVQDILPAHRRVFAPEWQCSADDAEEQACSNREYVIIGMLGPSSTSMWAPMLHCRIL